MTRGQVQALLPSLGNDLTSHLVTKWDALQKPAAKMEARIDKQDFDHIADTMGLSPFKANTEDKKRQLGELQFRVEQVIDRAQQAKKAPLTREEKMTIMRSELANTVTVDSFWSSPKQVPVISLRQDDLANVEVPESDKAQIAEALRTMFERTRSPMYAPTEQNMRRLYLTQKSKAAASLLPTEK
jgi:hypothetical protein